MASYCVLCMYVCFFISFILRLSYSVCFLRLSYSVFPLFATSVHPTTSVLFFFFFCIHFSCLVAYYCALCVSMCVSFSVHYIVFTVCVFPIRYYGSSCNFGTLFFSYLVAWYCVLCVCVCVSLSVYHSMVMCVFPMWFFRLRLSPNCVTVSSRDSKLQESELNSPSLFADFLNGASLFLYFTRLFQYTTGNDNEINRMRNGRGWMLVLI